MLPRPLKTRRIEPLIFIVVLIFIFAFFKSFEPSSYLSCSSSSLSNPSATSKTFYEVFNNTEEEEETSFDDHAIWCLHLAHRLESDSRLPQSLVLRAPSSNLTKLHRLPYSYTHWKSTPLLPRRMTRCEHTLIIRLLMIIERICRRHRIAYMISDGTLLGSLRHHDILPWDTDTDLMISMEDKNRFLDAMKRMNGTLAHHRILSNEKKQKEYYKIFFQNTPSAGGYSWNFPFIDVYVYVRNATHLWRMAEPDSSVETKYIFPLVMRPVGELWLPSPREPRKFYDFDPFDECKSHWWDHRNETGQGVITRKCNDLKEFYPFVEQNNQTKSREILKMNNTIIHTIIYN